MLFWLSLAVALFLLSMPMWWDADDFTNDDYAWWFVWLTIALAATAVTAIT